MNENKLICAKSVTTELADEHKWIKMDANLEKQPLTKSRLEPTSTQRIQTSLNVKDFCSKVSVRKGKKTFTHTAHEDYAHDIALCEMGLNGDYPSLQGIHLPMKKKQVYKKKLLKKIRQVSDRPCCCFVLLNGITKNCTFSLLNRIYSQWSQFVFTMSPKRIKCSKRHDDLPPNAAQKDTWKFSTNLPSENQSLFSENR